MLFQGSAPLARGATLVEGPTSVEYSVANEGHIIGETITTTMAYSVHCNFTNRATAICTQTASGWQGNHVTTEARYSEASLDVSPNFTDWELEVTIVTAQHGFGDGSSVAATASPTATPGTSAGMGGSASSDEHGTTAATATLPSFTASISMASTLAASSASIGAVSWVMGNVAVVCIAAGCAAVLML
ncbi:hypothetical protein DL546_000972 [Coniochaeta pulveracea]|uniref:Uncharacterized protein n=1 Tax=Coniochaeta pulveracea TaxID=177199 RepID=A0A420Y0P1_9PEZI|nr:hypothetical protein DL546_000972 [Coniochaeta pulveracea]